MTEKARDWQNKIPQNIGQVKPQMPYFVSPWPAINLTWYVEMPVTMCHSMPCVLEVLK